MLVTLESLARILATSVVRADAYATARGLRRMSLEGGGCGIDIEPLMVRDFRDVGTDAFVPPHLRHQSTWLHPQLSSSIRGLLEQVKPRP
jgi:hypothetical protein